MKRWFWLTSLPLLFGCATSGSAWVSAVDETNTLHAENSEIFLAAPAASAGPSAPQRLNRSVTLGEVDAAVASTQTPASAQPNAATTHIYINNYQSQSAAPYYFGRVGGYDSAPSGSRTRSTPPANIQPGQDFPAVPSYGPAFPLRSAPAPQFR